MGARHVLGTRQIGNRACHAQHAVITARRQFHALGGFGEKLCACRVRLGDGVQQFAIGFRIGADGKILEAFALDGTGFGDPRRDFFIAFSGRRQSEIAGGYSGDIHMQVNAVEQRPGNALLVIAGAFGRAAAGQRRIAHGHRPAMDQ